MKKKPSVSILLALPTYDQRIHCSTVISVMQATSSPDVRIEPHFRNQSLLTGNFNSLWTIALNGHREGTFTHFGMIHSDVAAEPGWIDRLLGILNTGYDLVSVVLPIKDKRGITSTAMCFPEALEPNSLIIGKRLLTVRECHELPGTFTGEDVLSYWKSRPVTSQTEKAVYPEKGLLLANTGLWLADLSGDWTKNLIFHIDDYLLQSENGNLQSGVCSEDWRFSRDAQLNGCRLVCTRDVKAIHFGTAPFTNEEPWGEWATDLQCSENPNRPGDTTDMNAELSRTDS